MLVRWLLPVITSPAYHMRPEDSSRRGFAGARHEKRSAAPVAADNNDEHRFILTSDGCRSIFDPEVLVRRRILFR